MSATRSLRPINQIMRINCFRATQNCLERLTHPDPEDPNPFFVPDEKVDVIVERVRPSATKVVRT